MVGFETFGGRSGIFIKTEQKLRIFYLFDWAKAKRNNEKSVAVDLVVFAVSQVEELIKN